MFCVLLYDGQSGGHKRRQEAQENKSLLYLQVLERGSPHATQGHRGSTRFESGGRMEEQGGSLGQRLHWDFCRKGKAGQNQHLTSDSLIKSSGLWAIWGGLQVPGTWP